MSQYNQLADFQYVRCQLLAFHLHLVSGHVVSPLASHLTDSVGIDVK